MHRRRDVIAVFCTEKFHVVPYRGFVFTVRGNQYGRFGKDRGQCLFVIDQHVPCGGAMKSLTPQIRFGSIRRISSRLSFVAPK